MFEETLVCDGCSSVIDGGSREMTLGTLRDQGGRAFARGRRGEWVEMDPDRPWSISRRHLCGRCATATKVYDDVPVPVAVQGAAAEVMTAEDAREVLDAISDMRGEHPYTVPAHLAAQEAEARLVLGWDRGRP